MDKENKILGWLFILIMLISACGAEPDATTDLSWSDVFGEETRITVTAPDTLMPPSSTRQVVPIGDSLIAVADSGNRRILLVTPDGDIQETLGQAGDGPGEFSLLAYLDADAQGRLYAFDVDGRTVSVFAPDGSEGAYTYTRQFTLPTSMVDMKVMQSHLITLSSTGGEMRLAKHTLEGEPVHEAQVSSGSEYEVFASRFNLGGLAGLGNGQVVVVLPSEPPVQWYHEDDLALIDDTPTLQGLPEDSTFPADLNPYDYTDEHAAWWSESWRVSDVYALTDRTYAVATYKPDGQDVDTQRVHVYEHGHAEPRATVYVPDDLFLIGGRNGHLYATADPDYVNGEETPLQIATFQYQLN